MSDIKSIKQLILKNNSMRYDNILRNREDALETLLVESVLSKDKLLEIDKILHEVFDYADELAFENTNLKLK